MSNQTVRKSMSNISNEVNYHLVGQAGDGDLLDLSSKVHTACLACPALFNKNGGNCLPSIVTNMAIGLDIESVNLARDRNPIDARGAAVECQSLIIMKLFSGTIWKLSNGIYIPER